MNLPESVSFPTDRENLLIALERFDNGVTVEDVVGPENPYDNYRYSNTALVQVLVDLMCHVFVKEDGLRRKLVREICKRLSPYKIVNDQLFLEENNEVRVAIKKKVLVFMKQVCEEVCPDVELDTPVLKYLESDNLFAGFDLHYCNNFTEIEEIGHGGFGTVFKVESKEDKKVYAVKKILFSYKNDASVIKVMREAKNLSALDHPNTINYIKAWFEATSDDLNNPAIAGSSDVSTDKSESDLSNKPKGIVLKDVSPENSSSDSIIFTETASVGSFKDTLPSMDSDSVESIKGTLPSMDSDSVESVKGALPSMDSDSEDYINTTEAGGTVSISEENAESVNHSLGFRLSNFVRNFHVKQTLYIQMEYCDCDLGFWLKKRAEKGKLPFEMDIFCMFTDILNGINYIHAKGIIHRDLKPHNIFYTSKENILKIGDFGLATLPAPIPTHPFFTKVAKSNIHTSEVGTLPYAAPEQLRSRNYTTKVDMYSLGIILIELMNTCGTVSELVKIIQDVTAGVITEEMMQFPKLGNLVKNLINKNPRLRMSATDVIKMMMDEVKTSTEREKKLERKIKTMEETIKNLTERISQLNDK